MARKTTKNDDEQPPASGEEQRGATDDTRSAEIEELTEKLKEAEKRAEENRMSYLRALADLDNYKKRAEKEKSELRRFGNEDIIRDVVPLFDTLDRAMGHSSRTDSLSAVQTGLKLAQEQLICCLRKHGLEEIEAKGKTFDPHIHEAMVHTESDRHEANQIIEEHEKGYLLHGRLLKPSRVTVCKGQIKGTDKGTGNDNCR